MPVGLHPLESVAFARAHARLGNRRLAYSPGSQSGVGEIIAARRKKENGLGGTN
jgi:hypothetical protein